MRNCFTNHLLPYAIQRLHRQHWESGQTLVALQDQLDSLTEVVLQNRRGLDLLTAENGGLCLFLNKECCFYVNQSGAVRNMAQQLREQIIKRREEPANSWGNQNNIRSWASRLLPLTGPLHDLCSTLVWPLYSQCCYPVHNFSDCIHKVTNGNSSIQPPKWWGALNVPPKTWDDAFYNEW